MKWFGKKNETPQPAAQPKPATPARPVRTSQQEAQELLDAIGETPEHMAEMLRVMLHENNDKT